MKNRLAFLCSFEKKKDISRFIDRQRDFPAYSCCQTDSKISNQDSWKHVYFVYSHTFRGLFSSVFLIFGFIFGYNNGGQFWAENGLKAIQFIIVLFSVMMYLPWIGYPCNSTSLTHGQSRLGLLTKRFL